MIYVPSYKRAKNCKAAQWLSKAIICCHKFEKKEYEKYNKNKIQVIPDNLAGKGMAAIRNWILEHSKDNNVLMIDDDVTAIGFFENKIRHNLTESEVYNFIGNGFRMCKEAGTVLWGLNLIFDKKAYREYSPFSFEK
jgi:hypothetical protein